MTNKLNVLIAQPTVRIVPIRLRYWFPRRSQRITNTYIEPCRSKIKS